MSPHSDPATSDDSNHPLPTRGDLHRSSELKNVRVWWRVNVKAAAHDVCQNRMVYLMAVSAGFGGMLFGWDIGLIGGILAMDSFKHSFGLDNGQSASKIAALNGNIVSVLQAGCFVGSLSGGYISERFGRKPGLLTSVFIFIVGSVIQVFSGLQSNSLVPLYVGRIIGGWGVGMNCAIVPVYISESSPKSIRGRMVGLMQLFLVTGIMLSFWVNYGNSLHITPHLNPMMWRIGFGCQLIPAGIFALGMLLQKESPSWLCEHGRYEEASVVVSWLRRLDSQHPIVQKQIQDIRQDFEAKPRPTIPEQFRTMFSSRIIFYRSFIGIFLLSAQQWTGTNSINYYSPQIFKSLGLTGPNADLFATGIYGVVKVFFTGIALALSVEQAGRKKCLIYGGLIQGFSFLYIAIFLAVHPEKRVIPASYVAIVAVYLYVAGFSFGWGATPFVVAGELPPYSTRSLSVSIAFAANWLFNAVVSKITPTLIANIGYGTFLLFAMCLFFMVGCVYIGMPETSGVALEDMGDLFDDPKGIVVRSIRDSPGGKTILRCLHI